MRIAISILVAAASLLPGVLGGATTDTESVPVPVPGPPGPPGPPAPPPPAPQCPECAGAQFLQCNEVLNSCACGPNVIDFLFTTCSFEECCKPVADCCEDELALAYTCAANNVPTCNSGEFTVSNAGSCCLEGTTSDGDRRSLNEVADLVLNEEDLLAHELMEGCKEEHFETFLFIDNTHFSAIASPGEQAQASGCPFLLVTSDFGPDRPANKKAWAWLNKEQGETYFPSEKKLYIGTFKGDQLRDAFQTASPANPGSYDFLTNNCADFMLNLASELGIKIDKNIVGFATRRLLADKSSGLMAKIKDSASYFSFFGERRLRGEEMAENDLVGLLVEKRAGVV